MKFPNILINSSLLPSLPVREVWIEISAISPTSESNKSLPVREVWIEIPNRTLSGVIVAVTSREGSVD